MSDERIDGLKRKVEVDRVVLRQASYDTKPLIEIQSAGRVVFAMPWPQEWPSLSAMVGTIRNRLMVDGPIEFDLSVIEGTLPSSWSGRGLPPASTSPCHRNMVGSSPTQLVGRGYVPQATHLKPRPTFPSVTAIC